MALIMILTFLIAFVPISSTEASGADDDVLVIVLDPGHGGVDGGATTGGILEKNVNLTIAKYMQAALNEYYGVEVYLTRDTDVYLSHLERVEIAASYDADIFISIHANSSTSSSANGVEVIYQNSNFISNYDSDISYTQLKALAQNIQDSLVDIGLYDRGIYIRMSENNTRYTDGSLADYYSVLCESKFAGIPAMIVEHGFVSNTSDRTTYLSTDAQLKSLAMADVEAIVETLGLSIVGADITITAPTNTEYIVGESLDTTGITVNAKYNDGTSATLNSEDYTITGFDSSSTGNKVVTISYLNSSAKFVVCILPTGSDTNSTLVGDVNGDGEIKASDYLIIKDSFLEGIVLSDAQFARADVKEDSEIKASDYLMIKDYFLGTLEYLREPEEVEPEEVVPEEVEPDTSTDAGSADTGSTDTGSADTGSADTDADDDTDADEDTGSADTGSADRQ